ncbi:beta-glucosidase [Aspergillus rambellii]|uniref:Probable beta-glucosidase L n=1 Tax=Aspergillus rambellii TaxID=308745 RepID=A0A0F8XS27_9EURO|nr:beta-glucosidase [Aspergillus rambellii]
MRYSITFVIASTTAVGATLTQAPSPWDDAYQKANADLKILTIEEKVGIVTGVKWEGGPCVGNTYAPNSIPYPSLCLQDGPLSLRFTNPVTVFPAGINAGATWDRDLIRARGAATGEEAKALGVHVQLGPVAGPLGKIPTGGRNWEGFSSDPYLSGIAMAETILGMQSSGVQACAKHFILNEQEHNRETISSNVDDRTMHELYLWPFYDAVKANAASFMCSYNKINGTWACENGEILNNLLKTQLGFRGYVMSDWVAQHSTVESANSGLDMAMPGSDFSNTPGSIYWGENLAAAVHNGLVSQERLDDMVTRILASWYLVGQDQYYPSVAFSSWNDAAASVNVTGDHGHLAKTIARDSVVLLKNVNNTLPLRNPGSLAIIGSDSIVNPNGPNACFDRGCNIGTLAQGWGSGTAEYPYLVAPLDAIQARLSNSETKMVTSITDDASSGAEAATSAQTAIVFITADSGEGYLTVEGNVGDRNNLDPWHDGNALVQAVARANTNTIVVIHSVGPIILETILAEPNVVAVVWAGLPGQESGNALAEVLFGDSSPSGKLPYTIAKSEDDYGLTWLSGAIDDFAEGLFIDYRRFDYHNITPRYEFGFGLSYTTFHYSILQVRIDVKCGPTTGKVVVGGASDLFDIIGTISASIQNTGRVSGAEVSQLYIGLPNSAPVTPPKQLRGFQKIDLAPGESRVVAFDLTRRDISYWDVGQQSWIVSRGTFKVYVGSSSRDIRLTGSFDV